MVHTLAGDGMLILWSTSYLDEAEQCKNILLLNKGELLYSGVPQTLTAKMAGRSFYSMLKVISVEKYCNKPLYNLK